MKYRLRLMVIGIAVSIISWTCRPQSDNSIKTSYFGVPIDQIDQQLSDLIYAWYPRCVDSINGGYWTNFEYDWKRSDDQPKMLVTQARHLWTISKASMMSSEISYLKPAARHGFNFLINEMWDTVGGGFDQFWHPESSCVRFSV